MQPTIAVRQAAATYNKVATRRARPELVALLSVCGAGVVGAFSYMGWKLATDGQLRRYPSGKYKLFRS
ncbi:hypothetical protein BDF22DRAFT_745944 [Syncephalis plumigaleata]|nr:hypothetical protein BDF22DRAFT_745944 [Syncephalis plumigaleata]